MKKLKNIFLIIIIVVVIAGIYFVINNKNTQEPEKKIEERIEEKVCAIENNDFYLFDENIYDIEEEFRGFKILEYNNTSSYAEIYYILYDYTTDHSVRYSLKVTDESNNNLLFSKEDEQEVIGGIVSTVKIKNVDLNSKINVEVFEKEVETDKITNSGKTQIDLSKDLVEIEKVDQSSNFKSGKIGDVKFTYIDSYNVYFGTTSHTYSSNLVGENSSLPLKVQYGNRLVSEEHIEFRCEKNVNNLSLEDAFKSMSLINEKFGQYGLSDVYGMNIVDRSGEITDTVIFTYEDVMKLCDGLTVKKDGKEYTEKEFHEFAEISMIKDEDVVIGNGIKAIKYHFDNGDSYNYYMFVDGENIYYINVPEEERLVSDVQEFLDSLEI